MDKSQTMIASGEEHLDQTGAQIADPVPDVDKDFGVAAEIDEESVRLIRLRFAPWAATGLPLAAGRITIKGIEMQLCLDTDATWSCHPGAPWAPIPIEDREVALHIRTSDLMRNLIRSASLFLSAMDLLVADLQTHEANPGNVLRYYLEHEDEALVYMFSRGEGMGRYRFKVKVSEFPLAV